MSKKYHWNWTNDTLMDEDLNQFIEVGNKKNNAWWRNLKSLSSVYKTHKEIFKNIALRYFNYGETTELSTMATAKTCPAIGRGLLDKIILIKLPCDAMISINEKGQTYWNTMNADRLVIRTHSTEQFYTTKENPFENKVNIKFELPISFSAHKDTYMFLQPQFHKQNYPCQVLNGSVNYDRIQIIVNTLIDIPKEQTEYYLKEGTVIAYMWFDNNNIKLEKNNKLRMDRPTKFFGNI